MGVESRNLVREKEGIVLGNVVKSQVCWKLSKASESQEQNL